MTDAELKKDVASSTGDRPRSRSPKAAITVAQKIVREIATKQLREGEKLPGEQEMLGSYGVARATLREALRFLELQGVITIRPGPGGGPVITEPSSENLASGLALLLQFVGSPLSALIEVRQAIGPRMASLAVERASPADIQRLEDTLTEMARNREDYEVFQAAHARFHIQIAWASGNAMFGLLIEAIYHINRASHARVEFTLEERDYFIHSYRRILDAIEAKDLEKAAEEMDAFGTYTEDYLRQHYPDFMSKPITWEDVEGLSGNAAAADTLVSARGARNHA